MNTEIEKQIAEVFEKLLTVCDGHPFAVNKAALQLVRDYMIRMELTSSPQQVIAPTTQEALSAVSSE